jgi:hypothetical protein
VPVRDDPLDLDTVGPGLVRLGVAFDVGVGVGEGKDDDRR